MESLFAVVQQWVSSGSIWLAAGGSFVGGALTAMNQCVLVMVPLLIGFIGGMDEEMTVWKSFLFTLVFIVGFSVELAILFTVGLAAAPFFHSEHMVCAVAAICVLMGLHFMDVFHIPLPISQDKLPKYTGFLGAALFGFMFGLVSLPCTGPALLLIMSVIPLKGALFGGTMMLFYGIVHCLLILGVGTSAGAAKHLLGSKRMHSAHLVLKKAAGALLAGVGLYIGVGAMIPSLGFAFWRTGGLNYERERYMQQMKWICPLIVLLGLPLYGTAATGPKIHFESPVQNCGQVYAGDTATTRFVFTNKGDEALVIKSINADCGCTKTLVGAREVPPNGSSQIEASFDTSGLKPGTKEKHVYVRSNDPKRPEVTLTLKADVIRELMADQSTLTRKLENFEERVSFPVNVRNTSKVARSITGLKAEDKSLQASLDPGNVSLPPGQSSNFNILFTLKPGASRPFFLGKIILETDHPREKEIELRYLIQIGKQK